MVFSTASALIADQAPVLNQRIEFRVSADLKSRMEEIAWRQGITVADLFRRAIGLYDMAYEQDKDETYMAFVKYEEGKKDPTIKKVFRL